MSENGNTRKILILSLLIGLIAAAVFAFTINHARKTKAAREALERKLIAGARMVESILPADYHERIENDHSITAEEYEKYRDLLNAYAWEHGLTYVYSYMRIGGRIYTASSSFTPEDMAAGYDTEFFYLYEDPSDVLLTAFDGKINEPVVDFYDDPEYGELTSVFIPRKTENGKVYIIGADFCRYRR